MSAILAVVGFPEAGERELESALAALAGSWGEDVDARRVDDVVLATARAEWELAADFSGSVGVLSTDDVVVAADASLYYREDLERRLRAEGVSPRGSTPSHLVAAGYRAWGEGVASEIEGDFAFVVWDRRRRRLLAARDPVGFRPLFYARSGDGVAVASSIRALTALPGCSTDLNVASLAAQAAGMLWSSGTDTAFRDVEVVPAAHRLAWEGGRHRLERYWSPTPDLPPAHDDQREAAAELRSLLTAATAERLTGEGTSTVWMSGGRDSTAVFAAGRSVLSERGEGHRLRPVSISYPPGDPGCEDEIIRDVAGRWSADVHWLDSREIPLVEGLSDRAAEYDEPPAHLYELWNRALARGTRATGGRLALDGGGGDNLFGVSSIVLADELRRGRLLRFARGCWSRRHMGMRDLARVAVLPHLPDGLMRLGERALGRDLPRHYLERLPAPWIRADFAAAHGLRERELAVLRRWRADSHAAAEGRFLVSAPVWAWSGGFMRGVLQEEGVEVRSPLLDRRLIEFALARPAGERAAGGDTKELLRTAMEGLLPASVVAPRDHRTGITVGYSRRRMREAYPALLEELFSRPLRLAELGIVDPAVLRAAADDWTSAGDRIRVNLFHAMKVEFWLRGRDEARSRTSTDRRPDMESLMAESSAA